MLVTDERVMERLEDGTECVLPFPAGFKDDRHLLRFIGTEESMREIAKFGHVTRGNDGTWLLALNLDTCKVALLLTPEGDAPSVEVPLEL